MRRSSAQVSCLGPVVVEPRGGGEVDERRGAEQAGLLAGLEVQRQRAALLVAVEHLFAQPAAGDKARIKRLRSRLSGAT